jgi:hypothetical protein
LEYDKQDQQGKAVFNEGSPHMIKQQEPAASLKSFFGHNHSIYSTCSITSKMVVKFSQHFQESLISPDLIRSNNNYLCLQECMEGI